MKRSILALILAVSGCRVGASLSSFPPVVATGGIEVTVDVTDHHEIAGELLAVEDSALLVVTRDSVLVRAPLRLVRGVRAEYGGFRSPLSAQGRERLRPVSRYPQGVSPELEHRLLAVYGQPHVTVVGAPPEDEATLLDRVRAATARYRDRAAAVQDGYRPIGPDVPSMGEHWISVSRVLSGDLDPLRPPILEYVTIDGTPALAGVAYVALVQPGESPPNGLPVPALAWHYHTGTVDEESFLREHAHLSGGETTGPRVAVLHLWAWLANPAGCFASDNWALPWLRLGWQPPPDASDDDRGKALALAAGGEAYFSALAAAASGADSLRRTHLTALFASGRAEIATILGVTGGEAAAAIPVRLDAAARRWRALWSEATLSSDRSGSHTSP